MLQWLKGYAYLPPQSIFSYCHQAAVAALKRKDKNIRRPQMIAVVDRVYFLAHYLTKYSLTVTRLQLQPSREKIKTLESLR